MIEVNPHQQLDAIKDECRLLHQDVFTTLDPELEEFLKPDIDALVEKSALLDGVAVRISGPEAMVYVEGVGVVLDHDSEDEFYGVYRGLIGFESPVYVDDEKAIEKQTRLAHLVETKHELMNSGLRITEITEMVALPVENSSIDIVDTRHGIDYRRIASMEVAQQEILESLAIIAYDEDMDVTEKLVAIGEIISVRVALMGKTTELEVAGYLNGLQLVQDSCLVVPEYFYFFKDEDRQLYRNLDGGVIVLTDTHFTFGVECSQDSGEEEGLESLVISGMSNKGVQVFIPLNQTVLIEQSD